MKIDRSNWSFSDYICQLEYYAEYSESPSACKVISVLLQEVKEKYPLDWKVFNNKEVKGDWY